MPADTNPLEPDPDDDLIAYLDGELDDDAAEAVESKLANDPSARSRADEYKKSFELLDYLPKSEPSSTFASRTITRLMPAVGASGSQPTPTLPHPRKVWPEVVIWGLLAVLAAAAAFAGSRVWRQATAPPPTELPLSDLAVIENLPLYAGVDDIDFLRDLAKNDLFDGDPADAVPPHAPPLSKDDRERLIEQFRGFPPARQQQLRILHQKLNDPTNNDRTVLLRTLETYAVWLARLPEADRKKVLDAAPDKRPEVVREVSEKRWRETLAQRQQEALKHSDGPGERLELALAFRAEEADRRQEWEIAQRQWQVASGRERPKDWKPWPFDQPDATKQVDDYIRSAFGVDPAKGASVFRPKKGDKAEPLPQSCRLTPQEAAELFECREAVSHGERWFSYGVLLLKLSEKYPTLPRFGNGKPDITHPKDVPMGYLPLKDDMLKRRALVGKWPDFADAVAANTPAAREGKLPQLGPCKPGEFVKPVDEFVKALTSKLNSAEKAKLAGLEGKWPEYPSEMRRLAREKNLPIPEVTLPGEPNNWKKYYGLTPPKK